MINVSFWTRKLSIFSVEGVNLSFGHGFMKLLEFFKQNSHLRRQRVTSDAPYFDLFQIHHFDARPEKISDQRYPLRKPVESVEN